MSRNREYAAMRAIRAAEQLDIALSFEDVWDALNRYDEPHRTYHNIDHVVTLMEKSDEWGSDPVLDLAIFFHDVIYVPGNAENEALSAEYAVRATGLEELRELIMDTKHAERAETELGRKLQDLDLFTLGVDSIESLAINTRVKAEFKVFPDWAWQEGRVSWIQSMLDKDEIFYTEEGKEHEEQARLNLAGELAAMNDLLGGEE